MGPIDLLRETQRVAGHPDLSQWHAELIEIGKTKAGLDAKAADLDSQRKNLDSLLAGMQRDVARYQEREKIENEVRRPACLLSAHLTNRHGFDCARQIRILELTIPFALYSDAKIAFEAKRNETRELQAALVGLEEANKPVKIQRE